MHFRIQRFYQDGKYLEYTNIKFEDVIVDVLVLDSELKAKLNTLKLEWVLFAHWKKCVVVGMGKYDPKPFRYTFNFV